MLLQNFFNIYKYLSVMHQFNVSVFPSGEFTILIRFRMYYVMLFVCKFFYVCFYYTRSYCYLLNSSPLVQMFDPLFSYLPSIPLLIDFGISCQCARHPFNRSNKAIPSKYTVFCVVQSIKYASTGRKYTAKICGQASTKNIYTPNEKFNYELTT